MTQPTKGESQFADRSDNPMISAQGAAITAVADATASNPSAPAAYSAHASGGTTVTSNGATDLDSTAAALATLRGEVATYEIAISALIVDVELARVAANAAISALEAHGLIADN